MISQESECKKFKNLNIELKKSVFELQTVNWKTLEKIPSRVFIGQLELLRKLGVHHIGYYPDDVFLDQPRLMDLQKHFSVPALP